MDKRGVVPVAASILGIILMSGFIVAVAAEYNYDNNYRKSLVGLTTSEEKCSKLEQKFDKEFTKQKCNADNATKKCIKIAKKFDKDFRKKCQVVNGDEIFLAGTASAEEDNGGNDKIESPSLNSYDYNSLTGYNLRWLKTSAGYEDYAGKSYTILYNTPKCVNHGCVILQGFDITDSSLVKVQSNDNSSQAQSSQSIVKGWTFEVYA